MEPSTSLDELMLDLNNSSDTNELETLRSQATAFETFNKKNELKFRFDTKLDDEKTISIREKYMKILNNLWFMVNDLKSNPNDDIYKLNISLGSQLLDSIRLISRDKSLIKLFENDDLLKLIRHLANLSLTQLNEYLSRIENDQLSLQDLENNLFKSLNVYALKAMSNLIYNSTYVLNYFVKNNVAEAITIHLRIFNPSEILNDTANGGAKRNAMIFNLRILFLLTALNKELRQKLEKLQLISYLIEIIDQIMKERLNVKDLNLKELKISDVNSYTLNNTNEQQDYCYLKLIDIEYLNEILKILYNLTMDLDSVKENTMTVGTMSPFNIGSFTQPKIVEVKKDKEEEEAHLMHMVSILRDLLTCRVETEATNSEPDTKLHELYGNIINVLTNMPSNCYEELLTPILASSITGQSQSFTTSVMPDRVNELKQKNIDIRIAQTIKRNTRTSRRKIKKSNTSSTSSVSSTSSDPKSPSFDQSKLTRQDEIDLLTLMNSDEDLEFEGKNVEAVAIILSFMSQTVSSYLNEKKNSDRLYPVLLLLILMSKSNKIIRHYSRLKVLPPLTKNDLINLPQNGLTIRNRLTKMMTDPNVQLKRLAAQFLYVLCKESVSRLIKYTGYGNAAGLLVDLGIMAANKKSEKIDEYSSDSDNDLDEYKKLENYINPVTGRAELEKKIDIFEGMTEEQKEYEALKLVNAFDKLARSNGMIKPARIGPDGRPVEIEHVLQLQDECNKMNVKNIKESIENDDDTITD
jgi:hypothetical protein